MADRSFLAILHLSVLVLYSVGTLSQSDPLTAVLDYASEHVKEYDQDLLQLVAIPSISSLPEHAEDIESAAKWLVSRLNSAVLEVGLS